MGIFIDYVTLMLVNMTAGLFLWSWYLWRGIEQEDQRHWAPGFGMAGFVAVVCGLHMAWTWPLPGSYNSAYGEMSVLLGALFLGAALALAKGWSLLPLGGYALFAGGASLLLGIRFIGLDMTTHPVLSGVGFILAGVGGIGTLPMLALKRFRLPRRLGALVILASALVWALTAYMAYWSHMERFSQWTPVVMQPAKPEAQ